MKSIIVGKNEDGIKLIKFLKNVFEDMPDSLLHKLLRKKYFKVNDKKADGSEILKTDDTISIFFADETFDKFYSGINKNVETLSQNIDIYIDKRIIYEDDNIIIYNKQTGLLSQSDSKSDISVNDILYTYVIQKENFESFDGQLNFTNNNKDKSLSDTYNFRPSIMNRLDRNTEGLIIFAKTYLASRLISEMIRNSEIEKHYKTIVNGVVEKDSDELTNLYKKDETLNKAIIKEYNDRYNASEYSVVKLKYKVLKRYSDATLLDVDLITGKSHQIRAQFSFIGHPIICDKKYMDSKLYYDNVKKYDSKYQKLACYYIKFGVFENKDFDYLSNREFSIKVDF